MRRYSGVGDHERDSSAVVPDKRASASAIRDP
jgi:hypothetical protein